jgi:hypothetical protein
MAGREDDVEAEVAERGGVEEGGISEEGCMFAC